MFRKRRKEDPQDLSPRHRGGRVVCPECGIAVAEGPVGVEDFVFCPSCGALITIQVGDKRIEGVVQGKSADEVGQVIGAMMTDAGDLHIEGGTFYGPVGVRVKVDTINQTINQLQTSGKVDIAQALKAVTDAVAASKELPTQQQAEVLDQIDELGQQAMLPAEKRSKSGVLKAVVSGVEATITSAGELAAVWVQWGPAILHFFGI